MFTGAVSAGSAIVGDRKGLATMYKLGVMGERRAKPVSGARRGEGEPRETRSGVLCLRRFVLCCIRSCGHVARMRYPVSSSSVCMVGCVGLHVVFDSDSMTYLSYRVHVSISI
jgi:hypothetical protein